MALITLTEFQNGQWDISSSLKQKRFNSSAENAQFEDLRPLMNDLRDDKFYWDLVQKPTQSTTKNNYQRLLAGDYYTYNNETYYFNGIKDILIDFTYARYIYWQNSANTAYGQVVKNYEDGNPLSQGDKVKQSQMAERSANRKWENTKLFLNRMIGKDQEYEKWINSDYTLNDGAGIKINVLTLA